jgi:putative two-component system response regulator
MEEKKILAFDDSLVQLKIYQDYLGSKYNIWTVNTAAKAVKYLEANKADVILLDVEMPDISGFDFIEVIRGIPGQIDVPIIMVSGNSGDNSLKAKNSGAFDFLLKPVTAELLQETIERALSYDLAGL